ncbi:sugar O-acetyltransferase [Hymenobacter nivis]|uniref:Nodulation protein L n=1 Tax=Hymenobacter nivis TaxID=1850093 RepID=A0A502GNV6_9BACT|nr:sugar O-acetyltransferase [Hymenobacter nivis]TPG63564.1 sugar O-acetyltransferase [Hymenobacter nivis]
MPTELEKMLAGQLYDASAPDLLARRHRAARQLQHLNALLPDDPARPAHLAALLGALGAGSDVLSPFFCDYGSQIYLGERVFLNYNCTILDCAPVRIGDHTLLGPGVQLYTASHPLGATERSKGPELAAPITIGRRVWLGGGVVVCPGVRIGDNTTIGAGSVVTRDVPANVLAAGNPCRVIRALPAE